MKTTFTLQLDFDVIDYPMKNKITTFLRNKDLKPLVGYKIIKKTVSESKGAKVNINKVQLDKLK